MKPSGIDEIVKDIEDSLNKNMIENFGFGFLYMNYSSKLLRMVKDTENPDIVEIAKQNHIINIVRLLENGLKHNFIIIIDRFNFNIDNITNKITNKLDFNTILTLFKYQTQMGEVLSYFFNFQNLSDIEKAFSNLFQVPNLFDFLKSNGIWNYVEKYIDWESWNNFKGDRQIIIDSLKRNFTFDENIYKDLKELLETRHKLIHDIRNYVPLSLTRIEYFEQLVRKLVASIYSYAEFISKNREEK